MMTAPKRTTRRLCGVGVAALLLTVVLDRVAAAQTQPALLLPPPPPPVPLTPAGQQLYQLSLLSRHTSANGRAVERAGSPVCS